jgi:hypothetical protein
MINTNPMAIPIPARIGRNDHRAEERQGRGHRLAQVQVDPAVPDVLHCLDQGGLDQEGGHHADNPAQEQADTSGEAEQRRDDASRHVDHEGDHEEMGRKTLVIRPGFA